MMQTIKHNAGWMGSAQTATSHCKQSHPDHGHEWKTVNCAEQTDGASRELLDAMDWSPSQMSSILADNHKDDCWPSNAEHGQYMLTWKSSDQPSHPSKCDHQFEGHQQTHIIIIMILIVGISQLVAGVLSWEP